MESITYEWGSYNHHSEGHDVSPDDTAQTEIAAGEWVDEMWDVRGGDGMG